MSTLFRNNQVADLYVGTKIQCPLPEDAQVGTLSIQHNPEDLWFGYAGPGGPLRTDLVPKKNIDWIKATSSDAMKEPVQVIKIVPTSTNNINPGQYINLGVTVEGYHSLSDTAKSFRYSSTQVDVNYDGADLSKELKNLAYNLVRNQDQTDDKYYEVYLSNSDSKDEKGTLTPVKYTDKLSKFDSVTAKAIVVKAVPQVWNLKKAHTAKFNLVARLPQANNPGNSADLAIWADIVDLTTLDSPEYIENGHKTAETEYFLKGYRDHLYRSSYNGKYDREPEYLVDPSKKYDYITIHYFYFGDNESIQRSEKDLIFVFENDGSHTLANEFIAKLNAGIPASLEVAPIS